MVDEEDVWWTEGKNPPGHKSLLAMIQKYAESERESWPQHQARSWHVSGLSSLCPRKLAMEAWLGSKLPGIDDFDGRLIVRLDVGSAVHAYWQNRYLGPMGILHGQWRCTHCKKFSSTNPVTPMPKKGCKCGGRWEYWEEVMEKSEEGWLLPVRGRIDGRIVIGQTVELLEFKTWRPDAFPVRKVPEYHEFQTQTALAILGLRRARQIYFDPSGTAQGEMLGHDLPGQEFVIEAETGFWKNKVVPKVEAAEAALRDIREGIFKKWPDRVCDKRSCSTAKNCGYAELCFSDVTMRRLAIRLREEKKITDLLEDFK